MSVGLLVVRLLYHFYVFIRMQLLLGLYSYLHTPKFVVKIIENRYIVKKSVITGKIRYIQVWKNLRTWYPTYFRVMVRLQPFPCLNSYSFPQRKLFKVTMYRNPLQKW